MQKYAVEGMTCAACSGHVEKAVGKVEGVSSVVVSLLTNSMTVEGTASAEDIISAVEKAGYGASLYNDEKGIENKSTKTEQAGVLEDKETPKIRMRFISSLIFLIPLMYLSMGHMMWNWPVPGILQDNHIAMGLIQLLFTVIIMVINQRFFVSGFTSMIHGAPNMDTLVAMGAAASFGYSVYALFAMTDAAIHGTEHDVMKYMHEFYFESAATILTLITLGKMLEAYSKGRTTDALKSLISLAPKQATVIRDGKEKRIVVDELLVGDIFIVKPGESIPVDGVVLEGNSAVDESVLTGESIPVDKEPGAVVSAATINQSGFIKCEATHVGANTTLSKIIKMVSDAAATKAPIAKIADKVSSVFVPVVITIAAITILVWLLAGKSTGFALARGIAVLVISCPCALGLATPVAIMVGNGMGAKHGILFKTAVSLEMAGRTNVIALDKTGTITKGKPVVTDVIPVNGTDEATLIEYAYALESRSEHPLAKAVITYYDDRAAGVRTTNGDGIGTLTVEDFKIYPGNGLSARIGEQNVYGGNLKYIEQHCKIDAKARSRIEELSENGKTPLVFATDMLLGIIAVADEIKEDSVYAIKRLREMGLKVVMLTGDNEKTANAIGKQVGVDEVIAGVLPDGKEKVIRDLKKDDKTYVAMVGDGINDAPALTRADVGIAIGAGTDVAIDAADVVLMKSSLMDVVTAICLSRKTLRNIHQNLFWAFFYNTIGIPLAAGVWYPVFGWTLNPMFGAAAMSLSSFCVITNALRLNLFKPDKYVAGSEAVDNADIVTAKKAGNEISGNTGAEFDKKTEKRANDENIYNKASGGNYENISSRGSKCACEVPYKEGNSKCDNNQNINNKKFKEENNMTKTINIEGMMCGHCEASVKKALEEISGVEAAEVSHEKKTAVVTLSEDVADDVLKSAVEEKDYKVTGIA